MSEYILSIDQGTSSTKCIIFDEQGKVVARASEPLRSYFIEGGLVEQDPEEIFQNVLTSVSKCINAFNEGGGNETKIKACGISNQRETFVLWDENGKPLHNAVVWQCKRSVDICSRLIDEGLGKKINKKTGLIIDPYFSGTKVIWLYENNIQVRLAVDEGRAYFGTIDTWLLFRLTNRENYFTDHSNASRTLFFNLKKLNWDRKLLSKFGLSNLNLPEIKPSASDFGTTTFSGILQNRIPVTAMIGDSHAAAFGEGCFSTGTAKATLGTGSSILMNIGSKVRSSEYGMVTTVCWSTEQRVDYAFEGVIVSCGATIEWLKNELGLIADSKDTEAIAFSLTDNNGVYLVPAFSGLGAPHWDMNRKASITGLTFDCNKNHIIRAALESIAYQIKDVVVAMEKDAGIALKELMVNGGITSNKFVMQFLSDLLELTVVTQETPDISALGAAYMAGLRSGLFKDIDHLCKLKIENFKTHPRENNLAAKGYKGWQKTIKHH